MEILQAIILGIIQGATEFIPVSSSGHLVLVPWLLGWEKPSLFFDVMTHWGTLVSIFIYFWKDISGMVTNVIRDLARRQPLATPESRLGWYIVLATLPAVVIGFSLKDQFESLFAQPAWVAVFLVITGIILWTSETLGNRTRTTDSLTPWDALFIGFAQSLAITPGISRAGATIGAGLFRGFDRPAAARFSFLLMIPVVFGAGLLQLIETLQVGISQDLLLQMVAGFVVAAITGYVCIAFLLRFVATRSVRSFAIYCWLFGSFNLLLAWLVSQRA